MPGGPSPLLEMAPGGVARLTFDAPDRSANVLTAEVMRRLAALVEEIWSGAESGRVRGVLVSSGKPASFIVGADIEMIGAIGTPDDGERAARLGQEVYLALERLPVPTLAAIHGPCMGGGTELALACRHRVASDAPTTRIGLPEVQLGILPAWGGTVRLPRLVGLQAALEIMLTGDPVNVRKARRIGLVDDVLPASGFADRAAAWLRGLLDTGRAPPRGGPNLLSRIVEATPPGRNVILRAAHRQVLKRTGGHYPAPLRILEISRTHPTRSFEQALADEARAAGELIASEISKNLIHVFWLREGAKKRSPRGGERPREIASMGVLGAGVMGGGIAHLAAQSGIPARVKDIRHEPVAQALGHASSLLASSVKRGRLSKREADQAMDRISGTLRYDGFGAVDLVVEAVVEKLSVKMAVFRELEPMVGDRCILATNTSSLSVSAMAEGLRHPERFLGMHFFNPVHRMPLVEVVRGRRTSEEAVDAVYAFAQRLGKVPIVVADGPGFLVNRILGPYLNEAGHLLAEGVRVEDVDGAALDFGMPMGPLRLIDEIGIDIAGHAGAALHEAFGDRLAPAAPLVAIGKSGRLGRKGGLGFYRHRKDGEATVDPEVYGLLGLGPGGAKPIPDREAIRDRLLLAMVNEAARTLDDGIAQSAADVDLGMIMGTGFPPFRGGLLRLADEEHPREILEWLRTLEGEVGPRFAPAPVLLQLARSERRFYEAFPAP